MPAPVTSAESYPQAMQLKKSRRCDLALPVFDLAMQSARRSGSRELELQVLRHRGECYQYQGDYALAWLDLAYGQLLVPEQATFYEALGWLAIFEGHYQTAQSHLERAQLISPQDPWVQLNLGWAYYLQGHTAPALTLWKPLLQYRQPLYRQALKREIKLLQNLKKPSEVGSQISFEAVEQLLAELTITPPNNH